MNVFNMCKWRFAALIAALFFAVTVAGVPARRTMVTLTQPDGTTLTAMLCGDELWHFYADSDGCMLTQDERGFYRKATVWEAETMREAWRQKAEKRNAARRAKAESRAARVAEEKTNAAARASEERINPVAGEKRGLVILANFMNLKMKTPDAKEAFTAQFNKKGYDVNAHIGSVKDYFFDQSYGQLEITFDVVGPVNLKHDYAYYGANDNYGNDKHPGEMVAEACELANDSVDFQDYDWDGDGEVEQVFVVYAGYGENAGAAASTIWPHEWALADAGSGGDGPGVLRLDGVRVNTYATSCELADTKGERMDGIGTACHEFSHCLGLPDTYDTSGAEDYLDMDVWDVMSAGNYSGPLGWGEVPCGFTAYERHYAGWLEYTELNEPCTVTDMPSLGDQPVAYVIYNPGNRNEYFTLENRQRDRWFSYMDRAPAQHGMLIVHIDYDKRVWLDNMVNLNATHKRMLYVPASGIYKMSEPVLFPGKNNVTEFTDNTYVETNTGGILFNRNTDGTYNLQKPVTDIVENDGRVSFRFMGGNPADGIEDVYSTPATPRYYTVGGARVPGPVKGVNIIRQGGKSVKVVNDKR